MANKESKSLRQTAIRSEQKISKEKGNCNDNKLISSSKEMKKILKLVFDLFWLLRFLWKIASREKSDVRALHGKTNEMAVPMIRRIANCKLLFAGPYPISEYMDNISRVGQVVMNENLHCHGNCTKSKCEHPFTVNVTKQPMKRNQMLKKP